MVTTGGNKPGTSPRTPVQPARTGGLFGRGKPAPQAPVKPTAPKVAGPKPGAKPANPKKSRPAKRQG
jgi:YidC/Oxa1 family membrane protein insertase